MARQLWEGWEVNSDDIELVRNRSGDRRRIGGGAFAQVYLARMNLRDESDNIIAGGQIEVAVKEFAVLRSKAEGQFPHFMREVFFLKHAQHSCIFETFE